MSENEKPDFSVEGEAEALAGATETPEATTEVTAEAKPEVVDEAALAAVVNEAEEKAPVKFERFQRVNTKLAETLAENEALKQAMAASVKAQTTEAVDLDKLEDELYDATQAGQKEDAIRLRKAIKAEEQRRAEQLADERAAAAVANERQQQAVRELTDTAARVIATHAFLDPDSDAFDEDGQTQVIALRDRNIAKGMRPGAALEDAAKKVARQYGTAEALTDDVAAARQKRALQAAGAASTAQPAALTAGVGTRAAPPVSGKNMSDEQVKSLDKKKMFAGDFE